VILSCYKYLPPPFYTNQTNFVSKSLLEFGRDSISILLKHFKIIKILLGFLQVPNIELEISFQFSFIYFLDPNFEVKQQGKKLHIEYLRYEIQYFFRREIFHTVSLSLLILKPYHLRNHIH